MERPGLTLVEHRDAVLAVLDGMCRRLVDRGFDRHAALLRSLGLHDLVQPAPVPAGLPVLSYLDDGVTLSHRAPTGDLSAAVAVLGRTAPWTQTAAYVRDPPSAAFLDQYAHATLAGSPDGTGSSASRHPGAALGLLLLGPDVHYPPHRHPADEVYLPLTEADWVHGDAEQYRPEPAGTLVHHEPWQPHGMRTAGQPLLAAYLWTGDVLTPSRFC